MTTVRVVQLFWWQEGSELGQRLFSTPRGGDLTTKDTRGGGGGVSVHIDMNRVNT